VEIFQYLDPSTHGVAVAALVLALVGAGVGFCVFAFVLWVWMLVNAIINPTLDATQRILWILGMWFLPLIITVVYFFIVYTPGRHSSQGTPTGGAPPSDGDFTY